MLDRLYNYCMPIGIYPHRKASELTKIRMSIAQKGKKLSKEHCLKISLSKTGIKLSQSHVENMRNALKGKTPWNKGKKGLQVGWNKGLKISDEIRKNISEAHKGLVSGMKGKKHSEETRRKISENRKAKHC